MGSSASQMCLEGLTPGIQPLASALYPLTMSLASSSRWRSDLGKGEMHRAVLLATMAEPLWSLRLHMMAVSLWAEGALWLPGRGGGLQTG